MRQLVTKYQPPGVVNKAGEVFIDEVTGQIKVGDGVSLDGRSSVVGDADALAPWPLTTAIATTAALQAAIDAASARGAGLPVGKYIKLVFPSVDYLIDGLVLKSNVYYDFGRARFLKSRNGFDVPSNSMLRTIDTLLSSSYYGTYKNIYLRGGIFDSQGYTCPAQILRLENIEDLVIDNVTVQHRPGCQSWAFMIGGKRVKVINPTVIGGAQLFQDGVHITHGSDISVIGGYVESGDDPIAFGIDAAGSETWDDEPLTRVTVTGTVVKATHGSIKFYYGLNTVTRQPFSGVNRGKIDGVIVRGITGQTGQTGNGGVYVVDTTVLDLSTAPASGATTAVLNSPYGGTTGGYYFTFSNGNVRSVTLTNGSTTISAFAALSSSATAVVSAVDPTRLKNIDVDCSLNVGSSLNDGQNAAGIYVLGSTNLKVKGHFNITDTALGAKFALGGINLLMGGDFSISCPQLPAGPGLSFYNSINPNIHDSRLVGGAGSGRGSIEQTGTRGLKISHTDLLDIPSNGAGLVVQSVGSGDFNNTYQFDHVTCLKATGATITRLVTHQNAGVGFVTYASMSHCDTRGQSNATAIDQIWNNTGFNPDVLTVGRGNRGLYPPYTVTSAASITIPAVTGLRHSFSVMSTNMTLLAPAANSVQVGEILDLSFTQDATGGRTVTWPASFKFHAAPWVDAIVTTDANKTTSISFKFDGTNYIQLAPNRWA